MAKKDIERPKKGHGWKGRNTCTQVHGNTSYNRKNSKKRAEEEINAYQNHEKELLSFLVKAQEECSYAAGQNETTLKDGSKQIGPYTKGPWTYTDTYKGLDHFKGEEEIKHEQEPAWKRQYEGGITEALGTTTSENLYAFLKKAISHFPKDAPWKRGPEKFTDKKFEYQNQCIGTLASFEGKERILHNGKEIYQLTYSGGIA